ncbi:MAG: hypothetical protein J6B94_11585 [Lachnospiraceae bacterium]|nr:hypothetical protein [Lachnospiraceae bacterium]
MKYYIGIDGGGSKTMFAISDESGKILGTALAGSAFYKQIGEEGVIDLLRNGVAEVCRFAEGDATDIASVCFGMPAWGESPVNDKIIEEKILSTFPEWNIHIVNDCEVGWAGSLELYPGINIVAGTGSIAFGKNEEGVTARCGGWSEWFGDEGSGYWLGVKCVQLFSRQSDGRDERGPLYEIVRKELNLSVDEEIIDLFEQEYLHKRDKIASLQKLLLQAAKEGDVYAVDTYAQAAKELYDIVCGVKKKIFADKNCLVSCSGGIFKTGDVIRKPFRKLLEADGMELTESKAEPYVGAVLLAKYYENK